MATLKQTPGELNIVKVARDGFYIDLDFNIPLTGYVFSASVVNAVTKAETPMVVTGVDLALGRLTLSVSAAALPIIPSGKHNWAFRWTPPGGILRTILAGTFEVVE